MEENHETPERNPNNGNAESNDLDKSNNEGCQKTIYSTLIWMGSPILGMFMIPLTTGIKPNIVGIFFNFMAMDLAIVFTFFLIDFRGGMREIIYLFKSLFNFILRRKSEEIHQVKDETLDPKYGRSAIWISGIWFALGGFVTSIGSEIAFSEGMLRYGIYGVIWGAIVYYLIQKKIFVLDSFYGGDGF